MTPFLSRILPKIEGCQTPADHYRVQTAIYKHATPADIAFLRTRPLPWSTEFDRWLANLWVLIAAVSRQAAVFHPREIDAWASFYAGMKQAPTLLIAFCGRAGMLFMPLSVILQFFPPDRFDVLVVFEPLKGEGRYPSFRDMIATLSTEVDIARYRDVRTIGTSSGGTAALAGGILTNASRGVSFSGHLPSTGITYKGNGTVTELEEILRSPDRFRNFACVYGADNEFDAVSAAVLAEMLPLRLFPIAGVNDHNVLYALYRQRKLAKILADVGLT